MICFEKFLSKQYSANTYNCWDFALDVWADLQGRTIPHAATNAEEPASQLHQLALLTAHKDFVALPAPVSPCFVLMQRQRMAPHIGVYINGKVLHMNSRGPCYDDLHHVTVPFPTVTFHAPK
jgi:hypothetical protein